ncbi:salt stress-induced hydrophobic peptide ESI3 isoform X1 [Arachis hypogaea]|uniref:salt stress-induced hydrophobic peptide ESI3 isoform X1 n=1 Tax=Arachis hypogaea TaxID=3818 RepID=UPI003B20CC39
MILNQKRNTSINDNAFIALSCATLLIIYSTSNFHNNNIMGAETFLEIVLAIFIPPVGVFLRYGCGVEFWIDLVLTLLGYLPGIIYAIYVLVV